MHIQREFGGVGMTTVFLLRHGALAAGARDPFIGQSDLPLSPEGLLQAAALGRALREFDIDSVYCSGLFRSRQTAEIIVGNAGFPIVVRRDLREIALGEWEGLPRQEVLARFPLQYAARGSDIERYRIPGGESFADCQARVLNSWREIIERGARRVVIVGHAGVNRVLLCHLLDLPVARLFSLEQDYGCINVIEYEAGRADVRLINGRADDLQWPPSNHRGERARIIYERTES